MQRLNKCTNARTHTHTHTRWLREDHWTYRWPQLPVAKKLGYPPPSSSMRVYLPRFHSHCTVCIICRVKSEQTPSSFVMGKKSTNVRHRLGLGHRSTGRSLLDAISFYKHHSCPVQYHTETIEQKLLLSRKVVPPTANK